MLNGYGRPTTAVFSLAALEHNLKVVRQKINPNTKVMALVKSDGYGHGNTQIALAIEKIPLGCDAFGVTSLGEALILREAGVQKAIYALNAFCTAEELELSLLHRVGLVIHSDYQIGNILKWTNAKLKQDSTLTNERPSVGTNQRIEIWLKMNIGMHRLGFAPDETLDAHERLKDCPLVQITTFMSHLSCADDVDSPETPRQIALFKKVAASLPHLDQSLANSAGVMAWPDAHQDAQWVRPGIMLYGINPMPSNFNANETFDLKPVMTLKSAIVAIRYAKAGEPVSYGATWHAPKEGAILAVIPVGYGDGYPRHATTGTPVLINQKRFPLVGRVCMDYIMVDISAYPDAKIGEEVILWGEGLPVEEVAASAGTIGYELCCHLTSRVIKIYQ